MIFKPKLPYLWIRKKYIDRVLDDPGLKEAHIENIEEMIDILCEKKGYDICRVVKPTKINHSVCHLLTHTNLKELRKLAEHIFNHIFYRGNK